MNTNRLYEQTLAYLFRQLPMFQRLGKAAFKKDLANIVALTNQLGRPFLAYPCIHIAGTNGKGSTAHMLSAILQAHDLKVGLYTSPHYRDFRERIKINGQQISQTAVIDFVENNKALFEKIQPSFFELTVALAFDFFAKKEVDIAIIETGLGGRLDSTNIIEPILSIITNISFDHQQFLGDTLVEIAGEKAGIIKKGVPVVIGETHSQTKKVFENKARELQAPLIFADRHYRAFSKESDLTHSVFDVYHNHQLKYPGLRVNLNGHFQAKNLQTVLQAAECLKNIDAQKLRTGLDNLNALTNFLGRWQVTGENPTIILDSAHNEAGLQEVMEQLSKMKYKSLHCVLGMVNDKEVGKLLRLFPPSARYYFAKADIPRGLDASILQKEAQKQGLRGRTYLSVGNALNAAKRAAGKDDVIFVGGSTFVVAEVV